jgi:uncharacterized protein YggE
MRILVLALALTLGQAAQAEQAQIVVSGEGAVMAVPDMAEISLGARAVRPTPEEAMQAVSVAAGAVLGQLAGQGIAPEDMQTTSVNLHRKSRWDQGQNKEIIEGYEASTMVRVQVRKLDQLGQILSASVVDGANAVSGLSFQVSDPRPLEDAARKAAVQDAMAKAALYAEAAGVSLGAVQQISDVAAPSGGPTPRFAMMESADAMPVAAGEIQTTARVTMVFEIAQ